MGSKEVKCPVCHKRIRNILDVMDSKGTMVCPSCKRRIVYEFKYKTKSLKTYPE